ncbi:hypothetical protein FQN55_003200 [Onygenales sp. PD_40]|nr:hypothetical protein FQN55_003200 [Onygenales sp. PD_40]
MDRPHPPSTSSSSSHAVTQQPVQSPPKFSRYRSVRKAAQAKTIQDGGARSFEQTPAVPSLPVNPEQSSPTKAQNESIKRSMSRYRHAKPGATKAVNSVPPPPLPPAAAMPPTRPHTQGDYLDGAPEGALKDTRRQNGVASSREGVSRVHTSHGHDQGPVQPRNQNMRNGSSIDSGAENGGPSRECLPNSAPAMENPSRRPRMNIDVNRANVRSGTSDSLNTPTTPSRLRNIVEPKSIVDVQDITNEELAAHERATARHNGPNPRQPSIKSVKTKGSGFLSRMRAHDSTSNSNSKLNGGGREKLKTLISSPQPMRPEDIKVVSGNDAPISAVNAGERKVLVTCNDSFISLPITPSTKVQDLLYSAANCLAENIEPQTAILLESFKQLGLERPLRKYEHVRDVMNSWDSDSQNHLIVSGIPDSREREGLDVKSAPRKQPSESSFHMYHSQRSGKSDKRWITLRSDGQVVVAKKQGAESTNICHLSDFDIYSPTSREAAKKVRAPKKICFAVKSQQKLNMFLTTENFVHYFATNDQETGLAWYRAVQQWRSWYLVNVLGEGEKEEKKQSASNSKAPKTANQKSERRNSSSSIPYQIGSFQPLLDMDPSSWNIESSPQKPSRYKDSKAPSRARSVRPQQPPVTRSAIDPDRMSVKPPSRKATVKESSTASDPEPFSSSGLLGRTYTQRKKALEDRDKDLSQPFTGHGLLNNLASEHPYPHSDRSSRRSSRDYSTPPLPIPNSPRDSTNGTTAFSRSKSTIQKPKPLIDLTPTYQEAPQHARKGRGVAVGSGVPLVEVATGPELLPGAIIVPSSTTWRKPTSAAYSSTPHSPETTPQASWSPNGGRPTTARSILRQRAISFNSPHEQPPPPLPLATADADSPFAPMGLLARSAKASTAQGWHDTGRGVATGDRNVIGRPMLDLSQGSQFAEGSLLRGVEAGEVGGGPRAPVAVVDRG